MELVPKTECQCYEGIGQTWLAHSPSFMTMPSERRLLVSEVMFILEVWYQVEEVFAEV
jgi:hypothetical protein